jgi:plasmid stabilization system protein ParE
VKPYRFLAAALVEYDQAARWYLRRAPPTAEKFVDAIERAVAHVRTMPRAASSWQGRDVGADIRCLPLAGFPYVIVYAVESDELVILAIAHGRRRPGYWLRRLGGAQRRRRR